MNDGVVECATDEVPNVLEVAGAEGHGTAGERDGRVVDGYFELLRNERI